jgi:hypothetical protein
VAGGIGGSIGSGEYKTVHINTEVEHALLSLSFLLNPSPAATDPGYLTNARLGKCPDLMSGLCQMVSKKNSSFFSFASGHCNYGAPWSGPTRLFAMAARLETRQKDTREGTGAS